MVAPRCAIPGSTPADVAPAGAAFAAVLSEPERDLADLRRRSAQPHFANARSVRNALERDRRLTADDLCTLAPDDILASRVFQSPSA